MSKDLTYTYVKKAYNQMMAADLDEAGLPYAFDLLTTPQKEFFISFFDIAQKDFREEYDIDARDQFFDELTRELGYKGADVVEEILDRYELKISK